MNNRMRQFIGFAIGAPVGLGLGISFFYLIFLGGGYLQMLGIVLFLALAVGLALFYGIRSVRGRKLADTLLDILYKEADPEKFVRESEKAIAKTRNRAVKETLSLNLAVGYEAMGEYGEAIRVMDAMDMSAADKISRAMYYSNLAAFCAENGQLVRAEAAYTKGQPLFEKAGEAISLAHVRFSRALLYYADEKYEETLDALETARSRGFEDRHSLARLQLFEARSLAKLGKLKEARNVYGKILQKNTYPFVLACAKKELAALGE